MAHSQLKEYLSFLLERKILQEYANNRKNEIDDENNKSQQL
ncbi:MAG: hypothetical protein ACR2F1_03850 [Nitrososphaeraceae archaeon]